VASSIILPILSTFNAAGVRAAQNSLAGMSSSFGAVGKSAAKAGFALVAFQAAVGSVRFAVSSVSEASALERNINALGLIFGSVAPRMEEFSRAAQSMGLSTSEAAKASTFLGSVLRGAGFSADEAANQTQRLVGLASDLATVYGYDVQEALTGMTALFRGEYDPIEKFGVAMKQAEVNAVLASKGLGKLTGQELLNAQQQVRLELLYQRTASAQGAFAKGAGTLFVEQKKLQATFTNMQATIGQALIPSLVKLMAAIDPIIQKSTPILTKVFEAFAVQMEALQPTILSIVEAFLPIVEIFGTLVGVVAELLAIALFPITEIFKTMTPLLYGVSDIFKLLAGVLELILVPVLGVLATIAGGMLRILQNLFDGLSQLLKPAGDFFGGIMGWLGTVNPEMKAFFATIRNGTKDLNQASMALTPRQADEQNKRAKAVATGKDGGSGTDYVKEFFTNLKDEIAKQNARIQLELAGVSTGLIDSILSNSDWTRLYKKIVAGGSAGIAALQTQFNKTQAGLEEIAQVAAEAAKATQEYAKAIQEVSDAGLAFTTEMASLVMSVSPMAVITESLGQFEGAVVSAFDAIKEKLVEAVDNKLLYQASADALNSYASATQSTLQGIARQRDLIAQRISDANDLISSTKMAVLGFGNITTLLESQSKTIMKTTESLVDGIRLTLTETLDASSLTGDLTKNFKSILDKTKKFALDLKELRRLGLDKNLFKQIVDAGLESGGATAVAIIAGGGSTIQELNGLFLELQTTGEDIAEQTAQVMFGAGVDVSQGLINGLLAQENALKAAAQTLADAFTSTFNNGLTAAINLDSFAMLTPDTSGLDSGGSGGAMGAMGGQALVAASVGRAKIFEVNINAGMITDKAELGQTIVDSITRYERTNGNVWTRA
jgi:hypothetical protein